MRCPCFALSLLCSILGATAGTAHAFSATLDLVAGYNDNAPLAETSEGSGFIASELILRHALVNQPTWMLEVLAAVRREEYFRLPDSTQGTVGGTITHNGLWDGRLLPSVSVSGTSLRDDLSPEDANDELALNVEIEWLASGRWTLHLGQGWAWQTYPHPQPASGRGRNRQPAAADRKDDLRRSWLAATVFLSPAWRVALMGAYLTNRSSLGRESYTGPSGELSLFWTPAAGWEVESRFQLQRAEYDKRGEGQPRRDTLTALSCRLNRVLSEKRLVFVSWSRQRNDSSMDGESYRQTVTQCGISLLF